MGRIFEWCIITGNFCAGIGCILWQNTFTIYSLVRRVISRLEYIEKYGTRHLNTSADWCIPARNGGNRLNENACQNSFAGNISPLTCRRRAVEAQRYADSLTIEQIGENLLYFSEASNGKLKANAMYWAPSMGNESSTSVVVELVIWS